jgi:hypothetical protein
MDRRDFLKVGVAAMAVLPFVSVDESQAADVQIFVRSIEHTIDTHRFNLSSDLYINQFYCRQPTTWVWTPYGWAIQAQQVHYSSNLNFHGYLSAYHQLTQRRENIKRINIYNADCIYILEDGSIKIYDRNNKGVISNSAIPNYAVGLRRIDAHYRRKTR